MVGGCTDRGALLDSVRQDLECDAVERHGRDTALLESSIRDSTAKQYRTGVGYYEESFGVISKSNPVTLSNLLSFIRGMVSCSTVQGSTIKQYVSAIRTTHLIRTASPFPEDAGKVVDQALKGAVNETRYRAKAPKRAEPLPPDCLMSLKSMKLDFYGRKDQMRSAALLASSLMLRFSDVPRIRLTDIRQVPTSDGLLTTIRCRNTKTNLFEDREVLCAAGLLCRKSWCLGHYLVKVLREKSSFGYLFPLLSGTTFNDHFRDFLSSEFPDKTAEWNIHNLSKHSFRHTGVVGLLEHGAPAEEIKCGGSWRSAAWESYGSTALKRRCRRHSDMILGVD